MLAALPPELLGRLGFPLTEMTKDEVRAVAARYGLTSTSVPYDGKWWNTMSTTADLVRYYDKLIDGSPQNSVTAVPVDRATAIPLRK